MGEKETAEGRYGGMQFAGGGMGSMKLADPTEAPISGPAERALLFNPKEYDITKASEGSQSPRIGAGSGPIASDPNDGEPPEAIGFGLSIQGD